MSSATVAVRGSILSYGVFLAGRSLNLLVSVILARLLLPGDFGVIAAAMLVVEFMGILRDVGTVDALIYSPNTSEAKINTCFWINTALGAVQCMLIYALSPFGTYLFDDRVIVSILQALAISPLINGITLTHDALLLKRLRFISRNVCELLSISVKTVVSIVLAFSGMGIWAIVIGQLASVLALCVSRLVFLPWLPSGLPSLDQARDLFRYGKHVAGVGLLDLMLGRTDQIVVTTVLGNIALGYYFIGMRIPELVLTSVNLSLTRVIFPFFSTLNRDHDRLVEALFDTVRYVSLAMIPIGVGMALVGRELIVVLFGSRWEPSIPVLQLLAISGLMQLLHWNTGDALKAIGRPDVVFKLMIIELVYAPLSIWGAAYVTGQLVYTAAAILGASTLRAIIRAYVSSRYIGFSFGRYLGLFKAPIQAALAMAFAVCVCRAVMPPIPQSLSLAINVVIGACVYSGAIWALERKSVLRAFSLLKKGLRMPQPAPADLVTSAEG